MHETQEKVQPRPRATGPGRDPFRVSGSTPHYREENVADQVAESPDQANTKLHINKQSVIATTFPSARHKPTTYS